MSNYVQNTNFATKDALPSGDSLKIVRGTEINIEFNNIATAVATKADSNSPTLATPTLVNPALGTPASGNLANCTFPTLNQNTTGNAGTATALQNARNIGGVSFNGTANINLPGVNQPGNQNTTGNAATATNATTAASCSGNSATATKLTTAPGDAPSFSARAWVNFDGTGAVAIRASGNVSSVTDNGTGDYTVNFTTAMSDANYVVAGSAQRNVAAGLPLTAFLALRPGGNASASVRVQCQQSDSNNFLDSQQMHVAIFR